MLRRQPLSLPYDDQLPLLVRSLQTTSADLAEPVEPPRPERFVDAVFHHGLAGHAARALELGALGLPAETRTRLARGGALLQAQSAALRRELAAIEPVLADACRARPVCIKGPALADRLYPDRRLRTFVDLDLLVPRARLTAGADALVARGYEPLHEFRSGFGERHGHDLHLVRRVGAVALNVELHWRVGDDPLGVGLDHSRLAGGDLLTVAGAEISIPGVAEQILVVAVHLLGDRSKRLIWVQDLALVARQASEPAWQRAFELADELRLDWALHRALDYAKRYAGLQRARPTTAPKPPPWGPLRAVEELDVRASTHFGRLATLGWRSRLRYLWEVLVPSRDGLRGTVGEDGAPTARLVGRHVRSVLLGLRPRRR